MGVQVKNVKILWKILIPFSVKLRFHVAVAVTVAVGQTTARRGMGGGSEFWDKIVNFWFYDIKKFLARILDRPDLSANFRPIFAFWNPKICKNWPFLRNFKDFLCSKLDFGPQLFEIHYRWFSGASLDPKDVFYRFWDHFR